MDNAVRRLAESQLGEENNGENDIYGDSVEEGVVVASDGSKDSEEEVFEEAFDSQDQFQEQGAEAEVGADVETIPCDGLVAKNENLSRKNETDSLEGAAGVPSRNRNPVDIPILVAEEKMEELMGVDNINKIDGQEISKAEAEARAGVETIPYSRLVAVNQNLSVGNEIDTLEEAAGVPNGNGNPVEIPILVGEEKMDDLVGVDNIIKIYGQEISEAEAEARPGVETIPYSGVVAVNQNLGVVSEIDTLEEAAGVPNGDGNPVDILIIVGEEKMEDLAASKNTHKIDGGGTVKDVGRATGIPEILSYPPEKSANESSEDVQASAAYSRKEDTKDSEQQYVNSQEQLEKQVTKAESWAGVETVPYSGLVAVSKNLSVGNEKDIFEEATAVPGVDGHTKEFPMVVEEEEKMDDLGGGEEIPKIDGGTAKDMGKATMTPGILSSHSLEKSANGGNEDIQASAAIPRKEYTNDSQANKQPEAQPAPEFASCADKSLSPAAPPARPAGLGRAAPLLEPAARAVQHVRTNGAVSHVPSEQIDDPANGEAEQHDETREKLQMIRVKFLRLAHRLGQTPHNVVVAQVLYRLGLAEQLRGRNGSRVGAFSFDRASAMAEHLEAAGQEPLDFSCTIMVLGKTGVGKSATINSIFDDVRFSTDAFELGTRKVQDVVGMVQGIKVRIIDTPGLLPSGSDQHQNLKILHSVKRFIKKTPPDIVLYLDRLDMQNRDFGDLPLLHTITEIFGPSIWFNAIVVLTHAASAPPDGPNGTASSYDMFVTQRSHVVQQAIRQAAGDLRLMNPISLVENHSACRTNRAGQRVLPNGQVWKPHLLLLSFASKILAEANALLKLQDNQPGKPFAFRSRAPPLPFLLSSLLQSRPEVKLPEEQFGDEDDQNDLDESSDSEDEPEYDDLPPFKSLTKAQVTKLTKAQKKAYYDELEYREKLLVKKQLKEEKRRQKMMNKMNAATRDSGYSENVEEENDGPASVPVPLPDLPLRTSFDSDNPTHRYHYLDTSNPWLVRPVLETHGWDHDVGYEGINVERLFVVKDKIPISFSGQLTKDKKDANIHMELSSSLKHGKGKGTSLGFDMQTVGKDLAYTLHSETMFSNFRKNKAIAGLSVTHLGDTLSAGVKVEDKLVVNKRFQMVVSGGAMTGRGDVAYGGSLEAQLKDKDYPLGRSLSTLGLSVMDWHGDLAVGCNIQSQFPVGRSTNVIARGNLNNKGAGQVSIRLNSSEQLQIALIGLIPLLKKLVDYQQQMQFGQ